jgi:hypothetical protein
MKVIKKWFGYRKKNPAGRKSSPLDDIHSEEWPAEFTTELLQLLNIDPTVSQAPSGPQPRRDRLSVEHERHPLQRRRGKTLATSRNRLSRIRSGWHRCCDCP